MFLFLFFSFDKYHTTRNFNEFAISDKEHASTRPVELTERVRMAEFLCLPSGVKVDALQKGLGAREV